MKDEGGSMSAIDERRTVRRYSSRPVDEKTIQALLAAATRAPSPHNRQPWRFAVVTGPSRARLASAMGERLRADLTRDAAAPEAIERDVARSCQRIASAPALILACLTMIDMDEYPDPPRNEAEHWMAGQAVAAAIQNLLLAAAELGLGACWMCAPLFCPDAVVACLGLPSDWQPQALITLGHPAPDSPPTRRERRPVSEVSLRTEP